MSAGRGAILVVVAIVVGVLAFQIVDDSSGPASGDVTTATVTTPTTIVTPATNPDGTTATTVAAAETTTTTKAKKNKNTTATTVDASGTRPPDQVVVQVLNGSGIQGAATQRTNDLKAKGYQVLAPGNAAGQRTGSGVMCKDGYSKEAAALVQSLKDLGVSAAVEALPNPQPTGFNGDASCYVILGK
jgi:hypothetical protein